MITGGDWIMSCPPTDQVVSRSPQVHKESPVLQPTAELGESLKIFKLFSRKMIYLNACDLWVFMSL